MVGLPEDLSSDDYRLVTAFTQERLKPSPSWPRGGPDLLVYNTAHFVFLRRELVRLVSLVRPEDFHFTLRREWDAAFELFNLASRALWSVEGFDNPFYENGEEVPGQRALSLNFAARVPLFTPDQGTGQRVKERRKDENGKPVGDPLLLRPDYDLRVVDGAIQLVPV